MDRLKPFRDIQPPNCGEPVPATPGHACAHGTKCREPGCLRACLDAYFPTLLFILLCRVRHRRIDESLASEAASEAALKALGWIDSGEAGSMEPSHRLGRLRRTAWNIILDRLRQQGRGIRALEVPVTPEADSYDPFAEFDPFAAAPHARRCSIMSAALASMGAEERSLLELRFIDGATYPQIASLLGCTDDTAERRVRRALDHLTDAYVCLRAEESC